MIIKFNKQYKKLMMGGKPVLYAKLLQMMEVDFKNLSPDFIEYDTDNQYQFLYEGFYIMLILQKPDGNIFTTLRTTSWEKWNTYSKEIGKMVGIEVAP